MRPQVRYSYYPQARSGLHFGKEELLNIGMAVAVLTIAFALVWIQPLFFGIRDLTTQVALIIVSFSFIAVVTGFLMHEIAHKIVAVRYGMWAEFRASKQGLLFALVTALVGIVLAAPGAVMISGSVDTRRNGKISVAGPLTNLGFGGVAMALSLYLYPLSRSEFDLLGLLLVQIANVNLILGTFNLIPIPPLDGSKVWRWNKPLWIGLFMVFIGLLAVFFGFI